MIDIQTKNKETTVILFYDEDIMEEAFKTMNKDIILKTPRKSEIVGNYSQISAILIIQNIDPLKKKVITCVIPVENLHITFDFSLVTQELETFKLKIFVEDIKR